MKGEIHPTDSKLVNKILYLPLYLTSFVIILTVITVVFNLNSSSLGKLLTLSSAPTLSTLSCTGGCYSSSSNCQTNCGRSCIILDDNNMRNMCGWPSGYKAYRCCTGSQVSPTPTIRVSPTVGPRLTLTPTPIQKSYVVILCRNADLNYTPDTKSDYEEIMRDVVKYWEENSYGNLKINMVVAPGEDEFGWYNQDMPHETYGGCLLKPSRQLHIPDFDGIFLIINQSAFAASGNKATFNLNGINKEYQLVEAISFSAGSYHNNLKVLNHEFGHTFGLFHSGSYGKDYESLWDVMAMGGFWTTYRNNREYLPIGLIAYQKYFLGWIPSNFVYISNERSKQKIYLEGLANPSFLNDSYLMAKIPIKNSENFYTVEARIKKNYDKELPNEAVIIHKVWKVYGINPQAMLVDGDLNNNPYDDGVEWQVGESFIDEENGIKVIIDSKMENGFYVTIERN